MLARGQTSARTVSDEVLKHRGKGAPKGPRTATEASLEICPRDGTSLRYAPGTSQEGRCVECVHRRNLAAHQLGANTKMLLSLADPEHSYNHRSREKMWARAPNDPGIAPGIRVNGQPLTWSVYAKVRKAVQGGCCAMCGRNFALWEKRAEAADHDHATGEFRGVICNGKTGCNMIVSRYEHGQRANLTQTALDSAKEYLQNPPIRVLLNARFGNGQPVVH